MSEYLRYHASFYKRFWAVFAGTLALDQLTKAATLLWIPRTAWGAATADPAAGAPVEVIPGFFNLVHVYNDGAAFSILRGYGWLLVVMALVALVGIFIFRRALGLERASRQWFFGLLAGGIFGNAVDRMLHVGVVDFLDFNLPLWGHWPAFNVADIGICVGVGIYVVATYREDRKQAAKAAAEENAAAVSVAGNAAAAASSADAGVVSGGGVLESAARDAAAARAADIGRLPAAADAGVASVRAAADARAAAAGRASAREDSGDVR